jgi:FkbM family methyltransferase
MRDWEQPAIPQQANQNSAFDSQFVARRPAQPANPPPPPPPPKPQPVPSQQWRRVANSHAQEREDIVVRFEEAPRSPLHPSTPPKYLATRCMSIAGMTRFLGVSSLRRMQRLSTPATHCAHPFFFCLPAPRVNVRLTLMGAQTNDLFFKGKTGGTVLESGALDGVRFSVSYAFEHEFGWNAVLIEPGPNNFAQLTRNRPNARKVHAALCSKEMTVHFAEGSPASKMANEAMDALAGIVEFLPEAKKQQFWGGVDFNTDPRVKAIKCRPLTTILEELKISHIDFWTLDVEGAEYEVLKTLDFDKVRVDVIMIEMEGANPTKDENVRKHLAEKGYRIAHQASYNTWFTGPHYVPPS